MKSRIGSVAIAILTILICLMLVVVIFKEKIIENTINTYFEAIYNVSPKTYKEITEENNLLNFNSDSELSRLEVLNENIEKYVKARLSGLYTEAFYEKYLLGQSEILTPAMAAFNGNLNIKYKMLKLKDANYAGDDKIYNFQIQLLVTERDSGNEIILINKGQISLKKLFLFYKIDKIHYDCDELLHYLVVETNS
ncbi:hypothetical protein [Fusibacter bizertensis]